MDKAVRLWQESCDLLAKRKSLKRQPAEAPLAFAQRVVGQAPALLPLAQIYTDHRYGPQEADWAALLAAAKQFPPKPEVGERLNFQRWTLIFHPLPVGCAGEYRRLRFARKTAPCSG